MRKNEEKGAAVKQQACHKLVRDNIRSNVRNSAVADDYQCILERYSAILKKATARGISPDVAFLFLIDCPGGLERPRREPAGLLVETFSSGCASSGCASLPPGWRNSGGENPTLGEGPLGQSQTFSRKSASRFS